MLDYREEPKISVDAIDLEKSEETLKHDALVTTDGILLVSQSVAEQNPSVFELQWKLQLRDCKVLNDEEFERLKKETVSQIIASEEEADSEVVELDDTAIGKKLEDILRQAVKVGASDVHIIPLKDKGKIKIRVAGVLETLEEVKRQLVSRLVNKIKEKASMDTGDMVRPQDGKMQVVIEGRTVEIRVATLPLKTGLEAAILRIQDSSRLKNVTLEELGMEEEDLKQYISLVRAPYGEIIDVGETGAGKSTTLYATIIKLVEYFKERKEEKAIYTVEDPVEVDLSSLEVRQIEVNPKRGLTFASILRNILRADPDVIMVGEIRDAETADIATQAALTGHLLLSTLHANDAPTAIDRLRELGVSPFLISNTVLAFLSQRLIRTLCDKCKKKVKVPPEIKRTYGLDFDYYYVPNPEGCSECRNGWKGRKAVFELLVFDAQIKKLVAQGATTVEIKKYLREIGWRNMWANGLRKVKRGETSLEELLRKIQPDPIVNGLSTREEQPDVGVVLWPHRKVEVVVEDKKGWLFDVSHKGLSILFEDVYFLELNRPYDARVDGVEISFIPKSYKKVEGEGESGFIVGGTYRGDLSKFISS